MPVTNSQRGFTLVEILVAMAIAGIVMAVIAAAYEAQVRGLVSQETMLDMQQGERAALEIMDNEIRMAGCDPTQNAGAQIVTASAAQLRFTMDIDSDSGNKRPDGDINDGNEDIRYALTNDADGDGIADGTPCDLGRDTGGGLQPMAENIDALNFVYLTDDNDGDGQPDVMASPVTGGNLLNIRAVQVTIVGRSGEELRGLLRTYTDNTSYRNQQGTVILPAQGDNFRRLRLTTTIDLRNN